MEGLQRGLQVVHAFHVVDETPSGRHQGAVIVPLEEFAVVRYPAQIVQDRDHVLGGFVRFGAKRAKRVMVLMQLRCRAKRTCGVGVTAVRVQDRGDAVKTPSRSIHLR